MVISFLFVFIISASYFTLHSIYPVELDYSQLLLAHFVFTQELIFSLSSPLPSLCISSASVLQQLSSPLCVSDSDLLIDEDLLGIINLHCPCLRELFCHHVFYITDQPVWYYARPIIWDQKGTPFNSGQGKDSEIWPFQ